MLIKKREGYIEEFNGDKITKAVEKAFEEVGKPLGNGDMGNILEAIQMEGKNRDTPLGVEEVQDIIETTLIELGEITVAKAFIKYRQRRSDIRDKGWQLDDLQQAIFNNKYRHGNETFDEWLKRVSGGNAKLAKLIKQKKFIFAGRILAHRGLQHTGKKITFSNCYVMPAPEDNIESIFDTAKHLARTYSYGGGCGLNISNLRPKGGIVNNSAKETSGATSFMELYDMTTALIGQNGRRGALMISLKDDHPDIEDFIDIKTKNGSITTANISIMISDDFMRAVQANAPWKLKWKGEGQVIERTVNARELFKRNAKNNWDWAEAGMLFWDTIKHRHLMSEHPEHEFAGVNPCAEEPLMANGSCLLGSLNLSEFVAHPFTKDAYFDKFKFRQAVAIAVGGLNEVLDEGLELHPLQIQKDNARDWRQIGLGIMGFADMLIKLGVKYGSEDSYKLSHKIGDDLINFALQESALLAKEHGVFPKYDKKALFKSEFFAENANVITKSVVGEFGLRNSQILTIAPTGSISTMWGISGGIEPIFATSYKRKTESIHGSDVYYNVVTPIVQLVMTSNTIMPEYIVTSHDVDYKTRVMTQAVWQGYIDASISSTVNLREESTIEDVEELFTLAWSYGCKGITVFRDGCKRTGILTLEDDDILEDAELEVKVSNSYADDTKMICPECGETIGLFSGGCSICMGCGYSPCS